MKQLANVEYIAGDIEISDDGDLTKSLDNLKIVVDQVEADTVQPELLESNNHNNNNNSNTNNKNVISIPEAEHTMKKKMRLISTDSGFGSFGRSESYAATSSSIDSILTTNSVMHTKKTATKSVSSEMLTTHSAYGDDKHYNEKSDKLTPLTDVTQAIKATSQRDDKIRDFQKARNTTLNNMEDFSNGYELDARLINRTDGFSDVQCYFDENGSPKVREKSHSRRKATLKQALRAKSLGASMDNDTLRPPKTPSCVSFSRLCKKFKETFRSKFCFFFSFVFYLRTLDDLYRKI